MSEHGGEIELIHTVGTQQPWRWRARSSGNSKVLFWGESYHNLGDMTSVLSEYLGDWPVVRTIEEHTKPGEGFGPDSEALRSDDPETGWVADESPDQIRPGVQLSDDITGEQPPGFD